MPARSIAAKLARALPLSAALAGRAWGQSFGSGITTGTISNAAITEASGIVASRLNLGILWTHNDSGHPAQIFPITPAGANLGTYSISGAGSTDWEDIAIGPGPAAGTQYLYIGDIGDNAENRASIAVYRVAEPAVSPQQAPGNFSISGAARFDFVYPDGPHNAESLFVDPLTRDIYIITKPNSPKNVYRAAYPQASGTTTLQSVASFTNSTNLTAADISPDGDEILIRSGANTSGRMFLRPAGGSIADAFATTPITIPLVTEDQGEAIGFDPQGWGYYTTSEGSSEPIHYFDRMPAHAVWTAATGSFTTGANWDIGSVPGANNSVHFGQTATGTGLTYSVNFGGNVSCKVAIVHRDNVTWNLNGASFTQSGFSGVDSLIVGGAFGESATLTILNGSVVTAPGATAFSEIGKGIGASGVVTLGSGGKWLNSPPLLVGKLGSGTFNVTAGAVATLSSVYLGGSTAVSGGTGVMNVSGGSTSISGTLKIWNNGTLQWNGGDLSISTLSLGGGGKAFLASGLGKVLRVSSVSIDSANASKLDLSDNRAIVDYSGASPIATIQALLQAGCNGGSWNGNGITSSSAALASLSPHKTALGFAEASSIFASPATFLGQPIDSTTILIRYTLAGDANLDGVVNALDFGALSSNFGGVGKRWSQGDYNFDGTVNSVDFNLIAGNFGSAMAAALATLAPEPSIFAILMLAHVLARRRSVTVNA